MKEKEEERRVISRAMAGGPGGRHRERGQTTPLFRDSKNHK